MMTRNGGQAHTRILLVDDDTSIVDLLEILFRGKGVEIFRTTEGRLALLKAKECHPDIIMLDLTLPDVDGIDVCDDLKNDPDTTAIPVLIVSARTGAELVDRSSDAGAEGYLRKPFSSSELMGEIGRILQKTGGRNPFAA